MIDSIHRTNDTMIDSIHRTNDTMTDTSRPTTPDTPRCAPPLKQVGSSWNLTQNQAVQMMPHMTRHITRQVTPHITPQMTLPEVADPDVVHDDMTEAAVPWVVLVWNDPINLMSYVVYVLQQLFGYSETKAIDLMLDVHKKGRAAVSQGTREKAEMDVFRLHEYGLWATMQKDL